MSVDVGQYAGRVSVESLKSIFKSFVFLYIFLCLLRTSDIVFFFLLSARIKNKFVEQKLSKLRPFCKPISMVIERGALS